MSISGISTALSGLTSASASYDASVQRTTSDSVSSQPSDDMVGDVTQTAVASLGMKVDIAVLNSALKMERSLVDVLA